MSQLIQSFFHLSQTEIKKSLSSSMDSNQRQSSLLSNVFYHYTREAESSIRYFWVHTSIFIKFDELITKYFSVVQFEICVNEINVYLYPLQAFICAYISAMGNFGEAVKFPICLGP